MQFTHSITQSITQLWHPFNTTIPDPAHPLLSCRRGLWWGGCRGEPHLWGRPGRLHPLQGLRYCPLALLHLQDRHPARLPAAPPAVPPSPGPRAPVPDRQWSLCVFDDLLEHAGPASWTLPGLLPTGHAGIPPWPAGRNPAGGRLRRRRNGAVRGSRLCGSMRACPSHPRPRDRTRRNLAASRIWARQEETRYRPLTKISASTTRGPGPGGGGGGGAAMARVAAGVGGWGRGGARLRVPVWPGRGESPGGVGRGTTGNLPARCWGVIAEAFHRGGRGGRGTRWGWGGMLNIVRQVQGGTRRFSRRAWGRWVRRGEQRCPACPWVAERGGEGEGGRLERGWIRGEGRSGGEIMERGWC